MNTEIITSILAVDFAIVLVYVAVRLSEICVKKMVRESEEDYEPWQASVLVNYQFLKTYYKVV